MWGQINVVERRREYGPRPAEQYGLCRNRPGKRQKNEGRKNGKGLLDGGESYAFEGEVDPEQGVETGVLQQPTGLVLEYLEMVG